MSISDPKIRSLFLSCDGFLNSAVVQKKLVKEGGGVDLLVDNEFIKSLDAADAPEAKGQPLLLHINQICDAGLEVKPAYWIIDPAQANHGSLGVDLNEKWSLYNGHTLHIYQSAGIENSVDLIYVDPVIGEFMPVSPNEHYQLNGHFGLHRCAATYIVEVYDPNYKILSRHETQVPEGKLGGSSLDDYINVIDS
ncbi:MAG: hypothetical protein PHU14_13690, partial [Methylovulum sp.]|nr:hypothetical protein [Methylovulum sp.]